MFTLVYVGDGEWEEIGTFDSIKEMNETYADDFESYGDPEFVQSEDDYIVVMSMEQFRLLKNRS